MKLTDNYLDLNEKIFGIPLFDENSQTFAFINV